MRNIKGFRFPHHAEVDELQEVLKLVSSAMSDFEVVRGIAASERDYLVGSRLCSPEFPWEKPGRALLLDKDRSASIMVNEEDHVRLQALTAGWSVLNADAIAQKALKQLRANLEFAWSPRFGHLAASPYNSGQGRRLSAMFHLIGLAHAKRLPSVLKALGARSLAARGLFGESSRAVGAFLQVSITDGSKTEFIGACEYLLREERDARQEVSRALLEDKARQAVEFVRISRNLSLADALRVLGYARWAAATSVSGFDFSARHADLWLSNLELKGSSDEESVSRQRADFLRSKLNC